MAERITDKARMYELLKAGRLGNTIPQFLSVDEWLAHPDSRRFEFWGVRSATKAMHPACRMYVPRHEVADYARRHFADGPNISMMVDRVAEVRAYLEVWDSPTGLIVEGVPNPDTAGGDTWRNTMRDPRRRKAWAGSAARAVLAHYLNADDLEDLKEVLDEYPDHVVELSALGRCIGARPGRNGVVWEVRAY